MQPDNRWPTGSAFPACRCCRPPTTIKIVIDTDREVLYRNSSDRFDNMLAAGSA